MSYSDKAFERQGNGGSTDVKSCLKASEDMRDLLDEHLATIPDRNLAEQ